jgi:hypothetical protein
MSFDEMYDEVLHDEFSSAGKHQAKAAPIVAVPAEAVARARHAAVVEPAVEADERPRGFQRYRTAALVGAGGMACAAAGAFLGGLGGYFTISPAAAHPVASPTITQDLPLAQAVNNAAHVASSSPSANGSSAEAAASFSNTSGSLTEGIAPFTTLTSEPLQNLPVVSLPGLPVSTTGTGGTDGTGTGGTGTVDGGSGGGGGGGGGTGAGCASGSSDLGLTCILQSLTGALSNLGSLSGGNPGALLNGLVPSLTGVVSDVTGTLQQLTSLLPIASLPVAGGSGGTTVLAGTDNPVTTGSASTTGTKSTGTSPVVSALAPVLNGVSALTGGALGSSSPSLPSLPLSGLTGGTSSLPSLPVTTPSGTPSTPPTVSTPSAPTSGGSNTINVPLPLPITVPTISIGGLSVGINSTKGSGLTLTLP